VCFHDVPFAPGEERDSVYAALAAAGMNFNDATRGDGGEEDFAKARCEVLAPIAARIWEICGGDMDVARAIGFMVASSDNVDADSRMHKAEESSLEVDIDKRKRNVVAELVGGLEHAAAVFPGLTLR
jgi:hypothetical protein